MRNIFFFCVLIVTALAGSASVFASEPHPWQLYFQPAATTIMSDIDNLHRLIMYILSAVTLSILIVMAYVSYRFHYTRNPVPAKFTHNVLIEIVWTIIPVIILCFISVPSFELLREDTDIDPSEMTIKIVGHQWYWEYSYPDNGGFKFDSYMLDSKKLSAGQKRLLDVDNRVVIPQGTTIRFIVTAADVLHSFAVPSFGVKVDAVPGRVNETYVNVPSTGLYYGQCSEICGVNHGFMPIAIQVVTKEDFAKWVEESKTKFAHTSLELSPGGEQLSDLGSTHTKRYAAAQGSRSASNRLNSKEVLKITQIYK